MCTYICVHFADTFCVSIQSVNTAYHLKKNFFLYAGMIEAEEKKKEEKRERNWSWATGEWWCNDIAAAKAKRSAKNTPEESKYFHKQMEVGAQMEEKNASKGNCIWQP